ncbi:rRNA maturation RNase YbeY [Polynucleobacter sp. Latsch14-2]|jgi:probable rRNA maturation factor|uniref:rRNA maturation RNase YbeY n=1 Tax=Polynucleobacter sp. Latsch14-2 TaxID=2576920 RepID=UPI001C0C7857|nr:rRNA maturation RNase YbeY [Polynucleobacter sp. Latsch14-2]MBU3613517.1 rRNA maturation RNase YbeY [Polynucleobacter sp. Latsch14-2]
MQKLIIEIQCASPALEKSLDGIAASALIKRWVKTTIEQGGLLTLRFVNQAEGKKLNLAFRNKDKPTNVLTFPYALTKQSLTADIIFCLPVIQREAREQSKTAQAHLAHLVVHGCLHAQGYDHGADRDAKKMESLEIKILKELGFTNPYIPQ